MSSEFTPKDCALKIAHSSIHSQNYQQEISTLGTVSYRVSIAPYQRCIFLVNYPILGPHPIDGVSIIVLQRWQTTVDVRCDVSLPPFLNEFPVISGAFPNVNLEIRRVSHSTVSKPTRLMPRGIDHSDENAYTGRKSWVKGTISIRSAWNGLIG